MNEVWKDNQNSLSKKVLQYDLKGHFIKTWDSIMQIQRELGYNNSAIIQCCLGRLKTCYGYVWRHCE